MVIIHSMNQDGRQGFLAGMCQVLHQAQTTSPMPALDEDQQTCSPLLFHHNYAKVM